MTNNIIGYKGRSYDMYGNYQYKQFIYNTSLTIGQTMMYHNFDKFLYYLEDLFVREFARGKGIGEALLRRLAKCTLEMEGGRLEWAVLDWNEPAISFYKKMGAVPLNEWTTYRVTGEKLKELAAL